ncbi:MAG: diaminopimelate decarboxylase [Puniceicoccales bacterium]|jgi:diaminopimelate decarboxylase|nr:diaminopimelate decarboxylase [Puniceicoccales bacterium]
MHNENARNDARNAAAPAPSGDDPHDPRRLVPPALAREIAARFGTPCFVYSQPALERRADAALAFPNAFGLTARFAMKALPNAAVLRLFDRRGLHFDASSGFEARRAILAGVAPAKISLSTQELPADIAALLDAGVTVNACSLSQLERLGEAARRRAGTGTPLEIGIRVNPGRGSGGTGKTNVGGPDASFGVWHEYLGDALALAAGAGLRVTRLHTHIGSGSDPLVWQQVAVASLELARRMPEVATLNLGGGYKVARVTGEKETDLQTVGAPVRDAFVRFAAETGRRLRLEIEPGTFLVANCGVLLATVQDVTDTGVGGRRFLKLDSGMTELLRPSLYGAQHPVAVVAQWERGAGSGERGDSADFIVVGHCCESGDLVTCAAGEPETLSARALPAATRRGDLLLIGGCGAYCSAMSAKNYNSFPEAPEVLAGTDGVARLIRRRQTLEQIIANEVAPE